MGENKQHFWHILLYYSRKVKMQLKCKKKKKICAVYGESAVTDLIFLRSFVLEIFLWMMLQGQVDQLKLRAIKLRH